MKKQAEAEVVKAKEAARDRVLEDFEKGQLFAKPAAGASTSGADSLESTFLDPPIIDPLSTIASRSRNEKEIWIWFLHGRESRPRGWRSSSSSARARTSRSTQSKITRLLASITHTYIHFKWSSAIFARREIADHMSRRKSPSSNCVSAAFINSEV